MAGSLNDSSLHALNTEHDVKETEKLVRQNTESRKEPGAPVKRLELFSVFEFLKLFGTLALLTVLFIGIVKWMQSASSSAPERVPGSQSIIQEMNPDLNSPNNPSK